MVTEYRTISQAAKRCDMSEPKIRRRLLEGAIRGEKLGSQWLIPITEVERLSHEYPLSEDSQ